MSEMIERVARALADADPCGDPDWDYINEAIAAIKAMRDPTDEMLDAAHSLGHDPSSDDVYTTMIDAALKGAE